MSSSLLLLALTLGAAPKSIVLPPTTVPVGETRVLALPCQLQRIAIGDASTLDVKTLGGNQVQLIGATLGRTTLLMWCTNDQRVSLEVRVVGRASG